MFHFFKKILNIRHKESDETFLQLVERQEKKISFILHMNSQEEAEKMLLDLIQTDHTKNCQILIYKSKDNLKDIVVEVRFSAKKSNAQEVCKLVINILRKEKRIKENAKSYTET
jgi:hypothetical protein